MYLFILVPSLLILFAAGMWIGKRTAGIKSKYLDILLTLLIIALFWIGKDTYLLKVFGFELMFSLLLQVFLLGILLRRITMKYRRQAA